MSRGDRLLPAAVGAAAVAGLVISTYLTVVHYTEAPLVCSTLGLVNCERVVNSAYGQVLGSPVPTSVAGLLWFGVSAGLAALQARRPGSGRLTGAILGWAAIGLLTVIYLLYVEIVKLGALCAWCTAAHLLVLAIFLIALTRAQQLSAGGVHREEAV